MRGLIRWLRGFTGIALVAIAAGYLILLGQSFAETMGDPSLSLVDGYWIGRLPWTNVGVATLTVGAHGAIAVGGLTCLVAGGAVRRLVAVIAVVFAGFWWLLAALAGAGGGCPDCPRPVFDPLTTAYSLPIETLLLLVVPAVVVGLLAISADRSQRPDPP